MYLINMRLLKSMCGDGCLALIQNDLLPRQAVLGFEERQLFNTYNTRKPLLLQDELLGLGVLSLQFVSLKGCTYQTVGSGTGT